MEYILAGLTPLQCLMYLNDIIVFGTAFEDHLRQLECVLTKLAEAGLLLNPSKCHFACEYSGQLVSWDGIPPDLAIVDAVPHTHHQECHWNSPIAGPGYFLLMVCGRLLCHCWALTSNDKKKHKGVPLDTPITTIWCFTDLRGHKDWRRNVTDLCYWYCYCYCISYCTVIYCCMHAQYVCAQMVATLLAWLSAP